ncbi:MAG: hypothetical protein R3E67_05050 [Pseudomonadales bacterium]
MASTRKTRRLEFRQISSAPNCQTRQLLAQYVRPPYSIIPNRFYSLAGWPARSHIARRNIVFHYSRYKEWLYIKEQLVCKKTKTLPEWSQEYIKNIRRRWFGLALLLTSLLSGAPAWSQTGTQLLWDNNNDGDDTNQNQPDTNGSDYIFGSAQNTHNMVSGAQCRL